MVPQWSRRRALRIGGAIGMLGIAGCLGDSSTGEGDLAEPLSVATARQFNSPGCNCCGAYASYLRGNVTGDLTETVPDDIRAVKREHGVPRELQSCHTLVLEGYVVEGHVPAEAIATLLEEEPAIDGIALPGMPSGSPGMGGERNGPFTIYAIGGGRSGAVYAEV